MSIDFAALGKCDCPVSRGPKFEKAGLKSHTRCYRIEAGNEAPPIVYQYFRGG